MKQKSLLRSMLLLFALIVGMSSAWATGKVLTFDLTSNPGGWPTANSTTLTDYTYTLDNVDYTFALKNVKCNSGYLMMTSVAVLGLPAIDGYKITKVVASNSSQCSTSTKVGISSSATSADYIEGGAIQTWSTQSSSYTYNLTSTEANTMYYLYVTNKNAQITSLELTYEENSGTPDPSVSTTVTIDATGITNTNVFTGTSAGILSATVKDDQNATISDATVTWSSSNTSVATIASDGSVTLEGEGTTTITASYAGVTGQYKPSSADYELTVTNDDPNAITIWSEDFSSYSANAVPSGGTYNYSCVGSGTKIYDANLAGGTAPELLVAKTSGSFTAVVPLNQASGNLKLTYKANKAMSVSTTTEGISGGDSFTTSGEHTVTFTGVSTSMTSITIVFAATSGDNVRLDDIVLKGSAQAVTVEAPTFSINGGTYYTAQSVVLTCATEGATIYYSTDNTNWNEYENAITVSTTTTLYAKAVKGSDESTVSSITITIAEKNDVVFSITDKSLAYGETYTITKGTYSGRDVQTDGTVSLTTNNANVVSVDGLKLTAEAVGTATITIAAAEGNTYKEGSTTITVTVTAPDAQATAPSGEVTTTFKNKDLEYDGTGIDWTASVDANSFESSGSSRGVQFGAAIGEFTLTASNTDVISKVSMVISTNGTGNTVSVKVGDSDFTTTYGVEEGDDAIESLTLTSGMSKETVEFTGNASGNVVISVNDVNKSVYFKSITLTKVVEGPKVILNAESGYASYCSEYPLDFSTPNDDWAAYYVSGVTGSKVTFTKITGKIKGGQGIILYGTPGTECQLTYCESDNVLSGNMLVGTLAPTYVSGDGIYGLSGGKFKKINAGTINAHKAYLSTAAGAPALDIEFGDETTGIQNIERTINDNQYYTLDGRRVAEPTKGIYIINGKKVVIK